MHISIMQQYVHLSWFLVLLADLFVQNEFRIDSSRLQPEDKGKMFRLMYFFMSFHHQLHQAAVKYAVESGRKGADLPKFELGHVLETMDLMSFNLVLREVETAISEKNTKRLAECVAVLKEMMHIVVGIGHHDDLTDIRFAVHLQLHGGQKSTECIEHLPLNTIVSEHSTFALPSFGSAEGSALTTKVGLVL